MKSTSLTLQQISERVLSELVRARTDFLLLQADVWKKMSEVAQAGGMFVEPNTLDLDASTFEFFIARKVPTFSERVMRLFRKDDHEQFRFMLCNQDEKKGIKITISVRRKSDIELIADIRSKPALQLPPEGTSISGVEL